ncbi:MAG: alpha/beta hydrolase family protein [Gordonia sp. (in: high G+C Gram-positive bacteria)]|uniref:alpha/beta hydrolase n=1 Tax=Gordonia sp. (in: high G+C Gram-positive bacteria) TaxID=84139 RepID=UPI003C732A3A
MKPRSLAGIAAAVLTLAAAAVGQSVVGTPATAAAPSQIVSVVDGNTPQHKVVTVYSQSMNRDIPLDVLRPRDTSKPAPVLYLLNGAGGGEDSASWALRTNYVEFFQNKQVNVVTPLKGIFSYYTDWENDDEVLGKQKWQTFLTKELPPLLDKEFKTTGKNGIAGISMAGTSVLNLAIAAPSLYEITASYSGCARTSDPMGQRYIRMVVEARGKADTRNMWGPYNGPGWRQNDPYLNAAKLRGTQVYLSSNSGLPGQDESVDAGSTAKQGVSLADRVVVGGAIEAATNVCTQQMAQRLAELKIPAKVQIRPQGTHSWGYWERELHASWPMIAKAIS